MPKLTRKSAKLFAENATAAAGGLAQFGSLAAGTPNFSTDPDVIQALQAYSDGWSAAVLGTKSPALEDRNALDYLLSYQQAYIMQHGIPEWLDTETYYENSYVIDSNGELRVSTIDNNTGHDPVEDEGGQYWGYAGARGSGKQIGEVYYSQSNLATDNKGALPLFTGEVISNAENLYPQFYAWVNTHSELCVSEADWQSALTTYGECPYYVINTTNKTIRLPKLANYVKFANSTDGITQKSAGLPNITGYIDAYKGGYGGGGSAGGAFTIGPGGFAGNVANEGGSSTRFTLNASNSNSEYGNSNTVTPSHTTLYPWVCAYNGAAPASVAQAAQFQAALTTKADTDFANITGDGKQAIVNNVMMDYENVVSVDGITAGVYTQVAKDSFVVTWGSDPFTEDYYVYVSPDNGTTEYIVGRRYNDENAQTEAVSFPFFVPKGWYFTNNAEAGYSARIYPLKGAQ